MRSSLIVLAIVLESLLLLQATLARHVRGAVRGPAVRRRRSAMIDVGELSLTKGVAFQRAEGARKRTNGEAAPAHGAAGRFTEWRYYGFRSRVSETDASVVEPREVVASSPAIGSVVTILPDACVKTVVDGRVYYQCGSVWYQRQDTGSNVAYVVVPAP